jgi:hypothetical protein
LFRKSNNKSIEKKHEDPIDHRVTIPAVQIQNISEVPAFSEPICLEKSFDLSVKSEVEFEDPEDLVLLTPKTGISNLTIHNV